MSQKTTNLNDRATDVVGVPSAEGALNIARPRGVVVYDGACAFCCQQAERLRRMDRQGVMQFVPRQQPGLEDRFPGLADPDFNSGMRWIAPDGRISVGADALYEIARQLPRWRRLAWLYRVPGLHQLARGLYAWIARNRYSLAGKCEPGVCAVEAEPRRESAAAQISSPQA